MRNGGGSADDDREQRSHERIYGALSHDNCRRVLAALVAGGGELTRSELASALERDERGHPSDVTPYERQLLLTHLYLPKLERAKLVRTEDDCVRTTLDRSALPPKVYSFIHHDQTAVAHCLRVLSTGPRGAVLEQLVAASGELRLDELVERLLSTGSAGSGDSSDHSSTRSDTLAVMLHHLHLPVLHKAGLLRYDSERKTVGSAVEDADSVRIPNTRPQ